MINQHQSDSEHPATTEGAELGISGGLAKSFQNSALTPLLALLG